MSDKPFCVWPLFHQKVNTDGRMRPCCQWLADDEDGDSSYTHEDYFHGQFMQDLRAKFSSGAVPANCAKCVHLESVNGSSTRLMGFDIARNLGVDITAPPVLISQEVDLSNRCNLRCRYCSSHRSRKWNRDAHLKNMDKFIVDARWRLTDDQAQTLRRLTLLGGEPLLHQKQIAQALTKMQSSGTLVNLRLLMNSNGTIPIRGQLMDLLLETKHTSIDISIDAAGSLNDYIRSDSDWSKIEQNLDQLILVSRQHPNFTIGLTCTLSVFNAQAFGELQQWWKQYSNTLHVAVVTQPPLQNACNLPADIKQDLVSRYETLRDAQQHSQWYVRSFNRVIDHLRKPAVMEQDQWKARFKHNTQLFDTSRSVRLADYHPDLAALVGM